MCRKLELIYSSSFSHWIGSVLYLASTTNLRLWQLSESHSSASAQIPFTPGLLPCKIRTRPGSWRDPAEIVAGSRQDLAGIPARFWPPGFFFPAGISPGSRQDSRREEKRPKSRQDRASKLAKILAGKQTSRWPKSRRDPAANLAKIPAEKQKPRRPKSRRYPATKLTKILAGKQ